MLRTTNVKSGFIDTENVRYVTAETYERWTRRLVPQRGDVFLTREAPLGDVGRLTSDDKVFLGQRLFHYRANPKVMDPRFLAYVLQAPRVQGWIRGLGMGATVEHARVGDFHKIPIPTPPLDVQVSIGDILSAYDDLIENNQRRIALLEEASRMLYREWFVRLRFPGHEHVKIADGVPEGWEQLTLGAIAETNHDTYGAKELPDEINYIDISSVTRGRITSKTLMPAAEAPGRARRKVLDGDIIWSNVRPNLRAHALILEPEENDVLSTGFTVLTAKEIPFTWLYQFVTTDSFVGYLANHATGAGYPAVRPDDFERATVVTPPKALLTYFHEATEPNFRLVAKLNLQNAKLAQARDLLLPRLMNGEIAV
jgi:type I restriction enzyme S subunit